jgi:hypothetical protein
MTEEDFQELLDIDKTTLVAAISTKYATNPVFLKVIENLIDEKLYTGAMLIPENNSYGSSKNKTGIDVLVNAITEELLAYYSDSNPLLPGSRNISFFSPAMIGATNVNVAIDALARTIISLPGGQQALQAALASTGGV